MLNQVLKIAKLGNPILAGKAQHVSDPSAVEIKTLIENMKLTLESEGGVGLAAPQVNAPLRIFIYHIPKATANPRYNLTPEYDPDGVPLTVAMNPVVEPIGNQVVLGWEGCLSIPGMMVEVERYLSVRLKAQDINGKPFALEAHGFHARAIQHEYDHLEGMLIPSRMKNVSRFGYTEEVVRFLQ